MCFSKSVVNSYQIIPDFVLIVIKRYKRLNKKIARYPILSINPTERRSTNSCIPKLKVTSNVI